MPLETTLKPSNLWKDRHIKSESGVSDTTRIMCHGLGWLSGQADAKSGDGASLRAGGAWDQDRVVGAACGAERWRDRLWLELV